MSEKIYQVALELVPGIGDVNAKNLIAYCGSASEIFKASNHKLKRIPGIGQKAIEFLNNRSVLHHSEEILNTCEKAGIDIHHYTDKSYPEKLKQAADAPNIIYSKGSISRWKKVLAIVGTRNATDYGRGIAEKIVEECAELDVMIVSGLAYGIDIASHRAALKFKIPTVGVLAGGLDTIYPSIHKKYTIEMLESGGGLISEHPPGTQAEAHHFPARNRIIAGMSDATIVVEAARKGGALITANIADSYNRAVFAVPGDLDHKFSEGCNYLIRNQKALIFTSVDDLKYHLNWESKDSQPEPTKIDLSQLAQEDRKIVETLSLFPSGLPVDELAWRAQLPINQLAGYLLNLEFQGLIKSLPGKKYRMT